VSDFELTFSIDERLAASREGCRLKQDAAYAVRSFARNPGFAAVIIFTLALGIGATTAIFSVVQAVLLNPLPFPNSGRLVLILERLVRDSNAPPFADSYHDLENWQQGSRSFERISPVSWMAGNQLLTGAGLAREVLATLVGIDFFPLLGMAPELGRTFEPADLQQPCTVVLKHKFWMETFSGQKNAIGQRIRLNQKDCTVAGVMPPEFSFYPDATSMWMLVTHATPTARMPIVVVGLLKPGVSVARAQQEVQALYKNAPRTDVPGIPIEPAVYPLAGQFDRLTGPSLRVTVALLFGAVLVVLLIGCLNIANLLLGKSVARRKELALRAALGSGRGRLARQLLTEALLLSSAGAALGIFLALGAVHYFRVLNPIAMPPGNPVAVNLPVLFFTASLAVLTALVFGLAPALKASRVDLIDSLRMTSQSASTNRAGRNLRRVLVVAEAGLSLALLAGAGLLIQSVDRLSSVPLGFRTHGVAAMSLTLPPWAYSSGAARVRFYRAALDRAAQVPGVLGAALASSVPPDARFGADALAVAGRPEPRPAAATRDVSQTFVSADYFRVMNVPLELGRVFQSADSAASPAVAIVNQALAREYFPRNNPIGKQIRLVAPPGVERPWVTIVGVVGNEKDQNFFRPMDWEETPTIYRPIEQDPPARVSVLLHTASSGLAAAAAAQKKVAALDADVPITEPQTMDERLARALSYPHFRAILLAAFAGFALLLAAIGLYAVLSQLVAQRTQEFGIRMAVGARSGDLLALVIREGMLLTLAGLAAGLIIVASGASLWKSFLYGVEPSDPLTLLGVSLLLLLIALLAAFVPARRASKLDPLAALRHE